MALSNAEATRIKDRITRSISAHAPVFPASISGILPLKPLQGKLYEAWVLAEIIHQLHAQEGFTIKLVNTGTYRLKQKGTWIKRDYPYFEVYDASNNLFGEIFTDTEFSSISYEILGSGRLMGPSYHELDIVIFKPGQKDLDRPSYKKVLLATECKATLIEKSTFREVLGFRRELCCLNGPRPTAFRVWPAKAVPADPASVHLFYSTDSAILKYKDNAERFGIFVNHLRF